MLHLLYALLATARSSLRSQRELALENLALRQQLAILQRKTKRPKLTKADRAFWVALSRLWPDWQNALHPREARDRDRLASQGLQALLELEEPKPRRSSTDRRGDPDAHPSNGPREPDLGSASHSRRVAQARLRGRRSHGVTIHAASAKAAVADLACVSPEPHQGPRFHRLLCRAHSHVSHPVRVPRARARAPTHRALQRHRGSVRAVDRPAIGQRLPLRLGAEVRHPGPRQDLWRELRSSSACDGNRAGPHRAALPVAESVLRARDRDPSAGLPRSRHRSLRAAPAAYPAEVPRVLSPIPDPPRARQGHPRPPPARVHRWGEGHRPPDGRRAASSLHATRKDEVAGPFISEVTDTGASKRKTRSEAAEREARHGAYCDRFGQSYQSNLRARCRRVRLSTNVHARRGIWGRICAVDRLGR